MSAIWDRLIACQSEILDIFSERCEEVQEHGMDKFNQPNNGWINRVFKNEHIRRAHIDVVDARSSKSLWMMHVTCMPALTNNSPIFGFDVIAGANKMTGAFLDFSASSGGLTHPMYEGYADSVSDFIPKKQRELPEWAKNIFSPSMVAAGNVNTEEEAESIINLALNNLRAYFDEVPNFANTADINETRKAQNWYAHNQQQNPHTPKVMKSLGLDEDDVDMFCKDMLFPTI
jgi:hypothetical protein